MNRKVFALGRMKSGQMNRTEAAYAAYLERQKQIGEIAWYRFESIKLRKLFKNPRCQAGWNKNVLFGFS